MNAQVFVFAHPTARRLASEACMSAPEGYVCRITPPVKSREQEEKYHAIIGEIAAKEELYGQKLDAESWKRLLIDAFKHETKGDPDLAGEWEKFGSLKLLPALNHPGFVTVGEQSRKFSKKLATAFIEWLLAFQSGANR